MKTREIRCKTKSAWITERHPRMMASNSRGILNVGFATESPLTVWEEKTSPVKDEEESALRLKIGLIMEEPQRKILQEVLQETVYHDRDYVIRLHRKYDWMGATIDGWVNREKTRIPVEYKTVSMFNAQDWADNKVPVGVAVQVQHQIAVMDVPYAIVMAWTGGSDEPIIRTVARDVHFIELLVERLAEFHELVRTRTPPPIDFSVATAKCLARLHPDDDGLAVALPENATVWLDAMEVCKQQIKQLQDKQRQVENEFKNAVGDHTYGVLPDGRAVSWKTQERKEYIVSASKSRVFRVHTNVPKGLTYVDADDHHETKRIEAASAVAEQPNDHHGDDE